VIKACRVQCILYNERHAEAGEDWDTLWLRDGQARDFMGLRNLLAHSWYSRRGAGIGEYRGIWKWEVKDTIVNVRKL